MPNQNPLTLLTPVKKDRLTELYIHLEKINKQIQANSEQEFKKAKSIHYARWFILNKESFRDQPATPVSDRLVFSSNFDGDEDNHLNELATELAVYIDQLYDCCEDYPDPGYRTPENRKHYLKKWSIKTSAFFVGAPGRTVLQIQQEKKLRDYICQFISNNDWKGKNAVEIHQEIKKEIDSNNIFSWAKNKAKVPGIKWHIFLPYMLLVIILIPFIVLWALYIFLFHELWDKYTPTTLSQLDDKKISRLEQDEDLFPQNQFTQVAVMKSGLVRNLNFRIWMLRTRVLAGNVFVKGKLLNIPTIHFARWVLFDNNKHILFFSNFDGSWQQYLGDFIDQSGWGLSGIFSNTVNFPKTRFMITGGAYDEEHFLAWSRSTQIPTQVWYSAYHDLSIKNINNNTKIRNELCETLNEEQAKIFLKRF